MIPLLRAAHLQPTLAVTVLATALALSTNRGGGSVWVALAVLSGQLSVGWSNDYLDRERDRSAARWTKPIAAGEISARTVRIGAVLAGLACVPLSLLSGWQAATVHIVAVAMAWAYNWWLRDTAASFLPYSVAFGLLPAFITLGLPGHPWPPWWASAAAGLMGTGAYFINVLPDHQIDAATGIHGLGHRLGRKGSLLVAASLMASATAVLLAAGGELSVFTSTLVIASIVTVGAIVVTGVTGHLRATWSLTLAAAALNVAVVISRGSGLGV
jgi:4-hydroxybenzoate polyprenyltransferase